MNKRKSGKIFSAARKLFTLLAAIFSTCTASAQQDEQQPVESRFLFVFSTSEDMKPRVPATQKEINMLLSMAMASELHVGDTMGVWTFDLYPRAGQFPLQRWQPDNAAKMAAAINKFIRRQSYAHTNNFQALYLLLDEVIRNSPRLTILIFCDGETEMSGTPYDAEINQVFLQQRAELKKAKQPFVVVLRTQEGKYVGASVNYSAGMVNLPPFPPLPPPPAPIQTTPPSAPPKPAPVFPLVIIGTHVETNWEAYHFALTNVPPPETNPPENETAPASINTTALPTNAVSTAATNAVTATNAVAASQNSGPDRRGTLALAAGFLIGAIALTAWFIFGSRGGSRGSLISHSMKK